MPKSVNNWFNSAGLSCVILCAGRGSRMLSAAGAPKAMVKIKNKPLLGHIVDYWKRFTRDFIFVVGYKKEKIIGYARSLPINSRFVEQKNPRGIAHALGCAEGKIRRRFVMVLGDCLCKGKFNFSERFEQGVGVWKTKNKTDIKRSYSVKIRTKFISEVEEKPKEIVNNLCGTGFYFLDKRVFGYIKKTGPSKLRNEVEITDVLQKMIDSGELIKPVYFKGSYINITYPGDLKKARRII